MTICFVTGVVTEAIVKRLKAIPRIATRYRVVVCLSLQSGPKKAVPRF